MTRSTSEHALLLAELQSQRRHVLGALAGLDEEQLRRPVLPSAWSCMGLLRHLTLDDERFWFAGTVAGDPGVVAEVMTGGWDAWQVPAGTTGEQLVAAYREEGERSDAVLWAADLDAPPAWWPVELFGEWRLESVREVALHTLVETATHAGHLDAACELLDGTQWLVLD